MLAALAPFVGVALAVGPVAAGQDTIGTPGDKNCEGQTTAWIAQLGHDVGVNGVGGYAAFFSASVKDLKAAIRAYCNP